MLLFLVLARLMEGVGLSSLLPLLSLANERSGDTSDPTGLDAAIRRGLESVGLTPSIGVLLVLILSAVMLKAALTLLSRRQVGYTVAQIATDPRLGLLRALLGSRWSYYTRQPAGAVANSMATEADRASLAYYSASLIASFLVQASVAIGFAVEWKVIAPPPRVKRTTRGFRVSL